MSELYNIGLKILVQKGILIPQNEFNDIVEQKARIEDIMSSKDFNTKYGYNDRFNIERYYEKIGRDINLQHFYLDIYDDVAKEIMTKFTNENAQEVELTEAIVYNNFLRALNQIKTDLEAKLQTQ
jgi:hypothetical protein